MKDLTANVEKRLKETTNTYLVELEFHDSILGGNPKNPTVFRTHTESALRREAKKAEKRGVEPPSEERIQEIVERRMVEMFGEDVETTIDNAEMDNRTGFKENHLGPYIEDRQVAAMLREMMSCLGITVSQKGSKQTHQHLDAIIACDDEGVPHEGAQSQQINFYRDGEVLKEVDDYVEMCAQSNGPQGPRSFIKQHDRIVGATIHFMVRVPANLPKARSSAMIRDKDMEMMLAHAQNDGLGASRSQAFGKFWLVSLKRLTNNPWVQGTRSLDEDETEATLIVVKESA